MNKRGANAPLFGRIGSTCGGKIVHAGAAYISAMVSKKHIYLNISFFSKKYMVLLKKIC